MEKNGSSNRRVHMANERTFLAWIRTSVGILALGFVIEKAAVFLKYMSTMLGNQNLGIVPSHKSSAIFGIFLMCFSVIIGILSYLRYLNVKKQIITNTYKPPKIIDLLLTVIVTASGVILIVYLVFTL